MYFKFCKGANLKRKILKLHNYLIHARLQFSSIFPLRSCEKLDFSQRIYVSQSQKIFLYFICFSLLQAGTFDDENFNSKSTLFSTQQIQIVQFYPKCNMFQKHPLQKITDQIEDLERKLDRTIHLCCVEDRAPNEGYPKVLKDFTITEKAPTRAFSWLKAPTSAFTFKTLC